MQNIAHKTEDGINKIVNKAKKVFNHDDQRQSNYESINNQNYQSAEIPNYKINNNNFNQNNNNFNQNNNNINEEIEVKINSNSYSEIIKQDINNKEKKVADDIVVSNVEVNNEVNYPKFEENTENKIKSEKN